MDLSLHDIHMDYAGTQVLRGVTARVGATSRIGLIGANGSGKTTLLRIISGDLEPSSGSVVASGDLRPGYVPQSLDIGQHETVGDLLLAEVEELRHRLRDIEGRMADSGADDAALGRALEEYGAVREAYDALSGDVAEELAEKTLAELGLTATLDQPLATLSGGERNVLALAVALMRQPNLLILDEPGNHLDFAGLDWLEGFLQRFPGAVLIVSHNRYLLDRVVHAIWHLDGGRVTSYAGGYSDFRFERLTRALSEQADYKAKSQHVARLTELVRQFEIRARATGDPKWGKRLKARRTQLEKARAELGEEPELEGRRIELSFGNVESRSDIALEVSGYDRAVGDRVLFQGAELLVTNGERVGLVGPNGSGKTTFLRDVVTTGAWENATIRVGPSMRIGYCAQHRDDRGGGAARPDAGARGSGEPQGSAVGAELATRRERAMSGGTLLDLALSSGAGTRQEAYKTLGRLLFAWGDLDRSVDTLSGGEWNRLQLGLAIIGKANLLVLDEPTNHLDIESREAVEEALRDFAGTILVVSHDRYFLDAVVTRVVELTELRLESHAGSFSEFWRDRRRALHRAASTAGGSAASRATSISARGRSVKSGASAARAGGGANARGAGRTPGDANARIEEAILSLETERDRLEGEISDAFQSGDYRLGRKLSEDLNRVNGRIEEMYEKWGA